MSSTVCIQDISTNTFSHICTNHLCTDAYLNRTYIIYLSISRKAKHKNENEDKREYSKVL